MPNVKRKPRKTHSLNLNAGIFYLFSLYERAEFSVGVLGPHHDLAVDRAHSVLWYYFWIRHGSERNYT